MRLASTSLGYAARLVGDLFRAALFCAHTARIALAPSISYHHQDLRTLAPMAVLAVARSPRQSNMSIHLRRARRPQACASFAVLWTMSRQRPTRRLECYPADQGTRIVLSVQKCCRCVWGLSRLAHMRRMQTLAGW